jgi:ribosome-associated heat shock protein Hsp15
MSSKKSSAAAAAAADADRHRLDKWLWSVRFYKTRSIAAQAITGGKVHLNGLRVKPAHELRCGDLVTVAIDGLVAEFSVLALPRQRGPATIARSQYVETPASATRRAFLSEQQRLAGLSRPKSETRPDKRERRELMKLQRDQR